MSDGKIIKVSGPLIVAENMHDCKMFDVVRVSSKNLIGEVIELRGDKASIQVYEETSGLGAGEIVKTTGEPLSVELGPGLLEGMYDGIQRPLDKLLEASGDRISSGVDMPALNYEKLWDFVPALKVGDKVVSGDIIGSVQENTIFNHKILVPNGVEGEILEIKSGQLTVKDTIAVVKTSKGNKEITMMQNGLSERVDLTRQKCRQTSRLSADKELLIHFFLLRKVAVLVYQVRLAAVKQSYNISLQNGRMRI